TLESRWLLDALNTMESARQGWTQSQSAASKRMWWAGRRINQANCSAKTRDCSRQARAEQPAGATGAKGATRNSAWSGLPSPEDTFGNGQETTRDVAPPNSMRSLAGLS